MKTAVFFDGAPVVALSPVPYGQNLKRCARCETDRPLDEFAVDRSKASGRKSHCKPCDNAKSRNYYLANATQVRERQNAHAAAVRGWSGPRPCVKCGHLTSKIRHRYCDACHAVKPKPVRQRNRPDPAANPHCVRRRMGIGSAAK